MPAAASDSRQVDRAKDLMNSRESTQGSATPARRTISVVIGLLAVLAIGIGIGRATRSPQPDGPSAGAGRAQDQGLETQPFTGPSRVEAGVPVGYAQTEAGAVAAASQFTVALGSELVLNPSAREAAIGVIALPEGEDDLKQLGELIGLFADRLNLTPELLDDPGVVVRAFPTGWDVASYTPDEATVRVWNTGLFVAPGREAFMAPWNTTTYRLRWSEGDWRVAGLTTEDGPTPPIGEAPADGLAGRGISEFEQYLYVAPE